jgi:hypothetical protein
MHMRFKYPSFNNDYDTEKGSRFQALIFKEVENEESVDDLGMRFILKSDFKLGFKTEIPHDPSQGNRRLFLYPFSLGSTSFF